MGMYFNKTIGYLLVLVIYNTIKNEFTENPVNKKSIYQLLYDPVTEACPDTMIGISKCSLD